MDNKIKITLPVSLIKGINDDDKRMRIGGIASTSAKDFDGETMNPKGFDTSYFENFGYINWAHQTNKDPLSIVGKPYLVKIDSDKNEMWLEAELFKSSPKARQVYKLGEILEAEGQQLAFSIEGKVIERDPSNPMNVLKAKITGCAITPTPKNNDSVAKILKGLDSEEFDLVKGMLGEESMSDELTEEEKKKKKEKKKSMDSASVAPLTKESLDGDTKNKESQSEVKHIGNKLKKGQVLTILREEFPGTSNEMLEETYNFILKIEKSVSMEKAEISPESLEKAMDTLKGVEKSVAAAEEMAETTEEVVETTEEVVEKSVELEEDTLELEEKVELDDEVVAASMEILKSVGYTVSKEEVVEEDDLTEDVEKSVDSKDDEDSISKVLELGIKDLKKGQDDRFEAVHTLFKGMNELIEKGANENKELREKLDKLGNMTTGKKSVTVSAFVEKGNSNDDLGEQGDVKRISKSVNKDQIIDMIDSKCGLSKGNITDMNLADSIVKFESSNVVTQSLVKAIEDLGYTLVD